MVTQQILLRQGTSQAITIITPPNGLTANTTTPLVAHELKSEILSHDFETLITARTASISNGVYSDLLKVLWVAVGYELPTLNLLLIFHVALFLGNVYVPPGRKRLSSKHQINENLRRELDNERSKKLSQTRPLLLGTLISHALKRECESTTRSYLIYKLVTQI